jgi:hypothetical protein
MEHEVFRSLLIRLYNICSLYCCTLCTILCESPKIPLAIHHLLDKVVAESWTIIKGVAIGTLV